MKKTLFIAVLSVVVLVTMIFGVFRSAKSMDTQEILMMVILFIVAIFAIVLAFGRLKSVKQNLPAEDEMSKGIKRKAAATAYYVSIYMWLAMMMLEEHINLERRALIGGGILGMALIFALSWAYHNYIGRSHD